MQRLSLCALALLACDDAAGTADVQADVSDTAVAETSATARTDTVDDVVSDRLIYPGLYRVEGLDPELPTDDLEPLWDLVGDGAIIGLGESIHTSGGFYAAKERLVRWLVSDKGLRVFAMETPRTNARALDDYLQSGPCDVDLLPLFQGGAIFGVFSDDHTEALFHWLCGWNATHADDHVHFFGFDAQQPDDDIVFLRGFVTTNAPEQAEAAEATFARCNVDYTAAFTAGDRDACLAGLTTLESALAELEAVDTRARAELAMALESLRSWQDEVFYMTSDVRGSYEARDVAMADLFDMRMALDFAGQRAIVWAHNYHLAADHPHIEHTTFPQQTRTFGSEQRARRGLAYRAVAIVAHAPGILWPGQADEPTITELGTELGSLERELFDVRPEGVLVYDPSSDWVDGALKWKLSNEDMIMHDNFDAIFYLRYSPAMDALLW